jgi:hypothetical protein
MAAPAEDPAEAAADRSEVPDSLGGRQSLAPVRPGVNVARGEDALRAYLAWDGHARAAHMDPDAFARWLEREVLQYMTANRASLLRARADGVRRLHAPTLDPLAHALERAEAEYRGSAEGARIERATHAVAQRRAAVAGIRSFLESTPATPELAAKQAAASDKLEHALASLPAAELELKDAVASSPLWRDVERKRDALRAERERTGLASADDDARRASNLNGNSLVTKGDDYEKTCADVVADAFLAGGLIGGAEGVPTEGVPTEGVPTEGVGVLLLRNVTLGLHSGELDCVLVRVNRVRDHEGESAFADAIPQDGDGTTGRRTLARRGRTAATRAADFDGDERDGDDKAPAVEVLAVFEFKRNPDDVARGFHSRQTTLAWLAGDEATYDPREWANRRHPSGHFRRGYHPMKLARWVRGGGSKIEADANGAKGGKGGKVLVLTRDSFRGFRRTGARDAEGRGGFYLDGVWLVTRPRTMCGLDAKVRGFLFAFFLVLLDVCRLVFRSDLVPTGGDSFAFGQRIWDAIALGPRGSSAVSASFIA